MTDKDILRLIGKYHKTLPRFPDGRINYGNSDSAPVLDLFVKYKDRVLLLKRSNKVSAYRGKWHCIGGFLDEMKPLKYKVLEELREELNIGEKYISSMKVGRVFKVVDMKVKKTWFVHPVLIELKAKPKIKTDWEHTAHRWISPKDIRKYDIVPGIDKLLNYLLRIS